MFDNYLIGLPVAEVPTPALVVDADILEENISLMSKFIKETGVTLRPHAKTHKTPPIAHMQIRAGAVGLCCATMGEAEAMVYAGINNIYIANEIVEESKIRRLVNLARQAEIIVAVDDEKNLKKISEAAVKKKVELGIFIDVDVGMGRCGSGSIDKSVALAQKILDLPGVIFKGLMGYEGHAVFIEDRDEREKTGKTANHYLVETAEKIRAQGIKVEIVSAAGTGTFDIASLVPGITEIEAGSYVFMDTHYAKNNLPFKQSLKVLVTAVSCPKEGVVIFDAGLKAISHERSLPVVEENNKIVIAKLAEEHALAQFPAGKVKIRSGDKVNLIPSHCCTTVNLYDKLVVVRDGIVEAVWPISGRRA